MTREIEWLDGVAYEVERTDTKKFTAQLSLLDAFPLLAKRVAVLEQLYRDATARSPEVGKVHGMMRSAPERATVQPHVDTGLAGLIKGLQRANNAADCAGEDLWPALARHVQSLIAEERRKFTKELSDVFHHGSMTDLVEYVCALGDAK